MQQVSAFDVLCFRAAWSVWGAALCYTAVRRVHYVLPPAGATAASHLTVVARLPPPIATALAEAAAELNRADPGHYYYPADTIHMTIQNLDCAREHVSNPGELLAKLRRVIESHPTFAVSVNGFGVSPNTVFAQLFPEGRALSALRRDLVALCRTERPPGPPKAMAGADQIRRDTLASSMPPQPVADGTPQSPTSTSRGASS